MKVFLDNGHFFEGVRWHDGHWWASDMYGPHVLKITVEGKAEVVATVPNRPSGLGWMPDGSMLIVSMTDRRVLRLFPNGSLREHANIVAQTGSYANDMVVDRTGRAYVSNIGFNILEGEKPRRAAIVRIDPDGTASIAAADLDYPNGLVISPDGGTLIAAETFGARLTAFSIADDGSLSDQRVWAQVGTPPPWDSVETLMQTDFAPDGCAIDVEGCIWVADAINGRVLRIAPGGKILEEIKAPDELGIYACALGGPDGKELLMCLARTFDQSHCLSNKDAALCVQRVDVPCPDS